MSRAGTPRGASQLVRSPTADSSAPPLRAYAELRDVPTAIHDANETKADAFLGDLDQEREPPIVRPLIVEPPVTRRRGMRGLDSLHRCELDEIVGQLRSQDLTV